MKEVMITILFLIGLVVCLVVSCDDMITKKQMCDNGSLSACIEYGNYYHVWTL